MARRRHTPEQIVRKLREAGRLLGEGASVADVARHLEVSEQTFHRRRPTRTGICGPSYGSSLATTPGGGIGGRMRCPSRIRGPTGKKQPEKTLITGGPKNGVRSPHLGLVS